MLCERHDESIAEENLFDALIESRDAFLTKRGLPTESYITARDAISDLKTSGKRLAPNTDTRIKGFMEVVYSPPRYPTTFQNLMRRGFEYDAPNSLRLARHKDSTIQYFVDVQAICRPGHCLTEEARAIVGTCKHSTTVLAADTPAPTVTTLPDDIIHYDEPRMLTVRENARLQSFPDWFSFQDKYTTGGKARKQECPRYTQVGNAVPPLLAEAIGEILIKRSIADQGESE
jgi:DNA (cytosine-5)-methyltransferase 1